MLEAVGHEFYPDFFHHCDRLLAPDGIMVVQVSPPAPLLVLSFLIESQKLRSR